MKPQTQTGKMLKMLRLVVPRAKSLYTQLTASVCVCAHVRTHISIYKYICVFKVHFFHQRLPPFFNLLPTFHSLHLTHLSPLILLYLLFLSYLGTKF